MSNIMLIGLGPHAKRIYYPICKKDGKKHGFKLVYCVDLLEKKDDIEKYFNEFGKTDIRYLKSDEKTYGKLHQRVQNDLDKIIRERKIQGVIIATEPLVHKQYAVWALKNGLHILMDKPITTAENVISSAEAIESIKEDYKKLERCYQKARIRNKKLVFSLMAQRRYHPAFIKMKDLVKDVFNKTNCPITSIQSYHGDGQWRMPTEIIDQDYHPYNQGYGKCSHSGYHAIDIISWLLRITENEEKYIDNVDIFANFVNPVDLINQLNFDDYKKLFDNFDSHNKYTKKEFIKKCSNFGEVDAFNSFTFKKGKDVMSLASVNLAHNGCSQRNWVTAEGRDLYKGNGRVRHESHYIEQGPFQSISLISYQSKEVNLKSKNLYNVGGEYHLDLHIFRNNKMFPKWKAYEKITVKDLNIPIMKNKSRGHQEDSRRKSVLEFISLIQDKKMEITSDFFNHKDSTMLLYGIYKSAFLRRQGENPLVNISF